MGKRRVQFAGKAPVGLGGGSDGRGQSARVLGGRGRGLSLGPSGKTLN